MRSSSTLSAILITLLLAGASGSLVAGLAAHAGGHCNGLICVCPVDCSRDHGDPSHRSRAPHHARSLRALLHGSSEQPAHDDELCADDDACGLRQASSPPPPSLQKVLPVTRAPVGLAGPNAATSPVDLAVAGRPVAAPPPPPPRA